MVIGEPGHGKVTSSPVAPPSRPAGSKGLESPQVVLLCAGAFRQADVVHGHLAAPASPALALQDDLRRNTSVHVAKYCFQCEDKR